jgi:hypothetical protein
VTSWAEDRRTAGLELDYLRTESATVACPECEAAVGEQCRNVNDGGLLKNLPHRRRMEAAGCLP